MKLQFVYAIDGRDIISTTNNNYICTITKMDEYEALLIDGYTENEADAIVEHLIIVKSK